MSKQPIKNSSNYEKFFSNEIKNLLDDTVQEIAREVLPVSSITPEVFFLGALGNKDSMMYKVLNGFLTTIKIEEIYKKLFYIVQDKFSISVVKPDRFIEYSQDLRTLFQRANLERSENDFDLITSDLILLAVMNDKSTAHETLYNLFADESLSYDIVKDLCRKMHETTEAIAATDDEDFFSGLDLADGDSISTITITGVMGDDTDPQEILDKIKDAFSNVGMSNKEKGAGEKKKKKSQAPRYCRCLNSMAEMGQIDSIVGRNSEISQIIKIFNRRKCNNAILVGEPGVGKTAIVEGLAKRIVDGDVPESIKNCKIYELNSQEIMAGTQFRGMFEERVTSLIKDLSGIKDSILFIDNIHGIMNDRQKSDYDFASIMSNMLLTPDVKIIAATTPKGYHQSFENDAELSRKFQSVTVDKPTIDECIEILENDKQYYEAFHKLTYTDEAIRACVSLASRYITDRNLPSSAIDIMDEAGAQKKLSKFDNESTLSKKHAISLYSKDKDSCIKKDEIENAKIIETKIEGMKLELAKEMSSLAENEEALNVTEDDIYKAVSEHTNIPIQKINTSEKKTLAKIDETLKKCIVGQDEAIEKISRAIKRNKVGLTQKNRPILSCMCIGSTGTGKTLMAKKLAEEIFGNEKYLVRFDMSEYSDKTSVNKLIGASAGYVGYQEGGLLTQAVKNKKHAVLLIDEIEKANEEVYNIFLQVLDEGFLTDNMGQKVDFKNTIIILTSNVGTKRAATEKGIGFNVNDNLNKKDIIEKELKNKFPPEFINRLDEIVYFNNLSDDNLREIIKIEINKLGKRLEDINFKIAYDDDVVNYLFKSIEKEKEFGARPILRAVRTKIEDKITDIIIENDFSEHTFLITVNGDDLLIQ